MRKKIKQLEVMVAETIQETTDTTTLVLFTGNDTLDYQPGHFLTIDPHQFPALARWTQYLEDIKGTKEKPRAYSLASAPHERYLAITVKEEEYVTGRTKYPPLLSPVLVRRTPRGTRMVITGFTGPYRLPDDVADRTDHIVHICAGSGIVPNWSILKHALARNLPLAHTLIYGNKSWNDIIYCRQLQDMVERFPDKVKVIHALSRDPKPASRPNVVVGRVTEELLLAHVPDPSAVEVFACGPGLTRWDRQRAAEAGEEPAPRFLESVNAALANIGIPTDRIHLESYG